MNDLLEFCWIFFKNNWEKCKIIKYEEDNVWVHISSINKMKLFSLKAVKISNNNSLEKIK